MRIGDNTGRFAVVAVLLGLLAGCGEPQVARGINDPYEERNRNIHEANLKLDQTFFSGPKAKEPNRPDALLAGVSNFASNWQLPSSVLNNILQLNFEDAAHNTARFLVNTTIGIGGLFDPATAGGVDPRPSDFGETLYVWGAEEGAYVELPFFGPSTTRDTVGIAVDYVTNPLWLVLPPGSWYVPPVINTAGRVSSRIRYGDTVDSLIYDSEDSYAQARLYYLENRRFQLEGGETADEELYDIYEEAYE